MTIFNSIKLNLKAQKGKKLDLSFNDGDLTSDGGVLPLQKIDERLGLLKQVANRIKS